MSLVWFYLLRPKISLSFIFVVICLLAVPAWVLLLFIFSPTDIVAQRYDLGGTWLRVVLGISMGSSLGLITARYPSYIYWLCSIWIGTAIVTFVWFLANAWNEHTFLVADFRAIFKYKHALLYFVMWPCLFAYSVLHGLLLDLNLPNLKLRKLAVAMGAILLVLICWLDFIAAHALNGILVAGLGGMLLLLIYLIEFFRRRKQFSLSSYLIFLISAIVLVGSLSIVWQYDQKYEKKLSHLVSDVKIGVQIEKYPSWRNDPQYMGPKIPSDESGRVVNGSTYERASWFSKGAKLLWEHPWGAGFSHMAFRYYMLQEDPNLKLTKTHSGWLDFALGLGLPGVLLTWFAMGAVIFMAYKRLTSTLDSNRLIALSIIWIILSIWMLWWPSELSEREFIEHLFFILALFAGILALMPSSEKFIPPLNDFRALDKG